LVVLAGSLLLIAAVAMLSPPTVPSFLMSAQEKVQERALLSSIARDKRVVASMQGTGLRPEEARMQKQLHARVRRSTSMVKRISTAEANAASGQTARNIARLNAANKRAAALLSDVISRQKAQEQADYNRNVGRLISRIKNSSGRVAAASAAAQAAKDAHDAAVVAGLKSAHARNQARVDRITQNEMTRMQRRMRHRQSSGRRRRAALQRATNAVAGAPGSLSLREKNFLNRMRNAISKNSQRIKATSVPASDAQIIASLNKANMKNADCLATKGYLKGLCP
jgi:hypothetical protein